jgi:hypothetical protein
MNEAQAGFGVGICQLKDDGAINNPYQKIACFGQRDDKAVGGAK